jgi:toxin-antitoxin system PIN domain toxin
VILVDTNLLVYAAISSLPQHRVSREWLDGQLNATPRVGLPWPSLLGFLRLVTNPRVLHRPYSVTNAWQAVEAWLDCPNVWIPQPERKHRRILASMLGHVSGGANLIPDAHMAALAIEHGLTLCSTDGDFARFPGLKWRNPLLTSGS